MENISVLNRSLEQAAFLTFLINLTTRCSCRILSHFHSNTAVLICSY